MDYKNKIKEINKCRICENASLIPILDLGSQYLSGRFPSNEEKDPLKTPLQLVKCDDSQNKNACGLLQLKHTAELGEMYGAGYGYRSGVNETMINHLNNMVKVIENIVELNQGDIVLDTGSSDATLLKAYKASNIRKIGIDPSGEKFLKYYPKDIKLIADYFSAEKYESLYPNKKAKVITSIAMFYDLEEPMKFVKDIKNILHLEGIWVCEQSYTPEMITVNSFDTICQEHLEYYSLKQIEWMLERNELKIFDIELNEINGGSFRVYVCHKENPRKINEEKINELRNSEKLLELDTKKPYEVFKERVMKIKEKLCNFLIYEKSKGKKIHIYGASTKGNIILQFFNIGKDIVDVAADRNPDKWGKETPGTRIPIISEEESRNANPDYYLVLPWHFRREFIEREQAFLRKGGKLIFPLPQPEVVSADNKSYLLEIE